jgi:DMSO/TMAO reductase YedYZ molybdopterin-dependent catalytic subunit
MIATRTLGLACATLLYASLVWAQPARPSVAPPTGTLVISGDVAKPMTLTPAELKTLPRKTVTLQEDGRPVSYEGVLVGELLKRAGAAAGSDLRGGAVAVYVVATGNDGYQAVYSVAELDAVFTNSEIIVADSVDGKPLFDYQGPFRLVAPKDTRGARSVRMLEKLEVVRLRK